MVQATLRVRKGGQVCKRPVPQSLISFGPAGRDGHWGLVVTSSYKGGLADPQLRASNEHILIVRVLRAKGIDQAVRYFFSHFIVCWKTHFGQV